MNHATAWAMRDVVFDSLLYLAGRAFQAVRILRSPRLFVSPIQGIRKCSVLSVMNRDEFRTKVVEVIGDDPTFTNKLLVINAKRAF